MSYTHVRVINYKALFSLLAPFVTIGALVGFSLYYKLAMNIHYPLAAVLNT